MAGQCLKCVYFRANVHPAKDQRHHCAALDQPLGDEQAQAICPEMKNA